MQREIVRQLVPTWWRENEYFLRRAGAVLLLLGGIKKNDETLVNSDNAFSLCDPSRSGDVSWPPPEESLSGVEKMER